MNKLKQAQWKTLFSETQQESESGGNAKVFFVRRISDNKEFALKQLVVGGEKKQRFLEEIAILLKYKGYPNIMPLVEYNEEYYWYTMPIATLSQKYIEEKKVAEKDIVTGIIQISNLLIMLHKDGATHRDIKPSNICVVDGVFCLGDFGLVGLPNINGRLTQSDKPLGAIFTLAPEMKRDPKNADGKKADVYSLAKTIWMLLTGDDKGFEGVYNFRDKKHQLRPKIKNKELHLVELEEALKNATENDPDLRPDMVSFSRKLKEWIAIAENPHKSQKSSWDYIRKYLFNGNSPQSVVWDNKKDIVEILNIIAASGAYNHMLFPRGGSYGGGGLDFFGASETKEDGCICLTTHLNSHHVGKIKNLYYESFANDYEWNYFLVEFDDLDEIFERKEYGYENLVEDKPGNYVSAQYAHYGVYDYDEGNLLPDGHRIVQRYFDSEKAKFLIVLKSGSYNAIGATYDGRHSCCDINEFKKYYKEKLYNRYKDCINKGYKGSVFLRWEGHTRNPFIKVKESSDDNEIKNEISSSEIATEFIRNNFMSWNFNGILATAKKCDGNEKIRYYFEYDGEIVYDVFTRIGDRYLFDTLLRHDGKIYKSEKDNFNDAFYVATREEAVRIVDECNEFVRSICKTKGIITSINCFSATPRKQGKPTHLFTKDEIAKLMRNADDRNTNRLVVDEEGYAHLLQVNDWETDRFCHLYPVREEQFDAGCNYVGKFSSLGSLESNYLTLLNGWLSYLETGKRYYLDYCGNENEQKLLTEIKKYY